MSGYFTIFPDVSCLSGEQNYRKALLNASEFPTIGKESPQVCEMILWGPAPPIVSVRLLFRKGLNGVPQIKWRDWSWAANNTTRALLIDASSKQSYDSPPLEMHQLECFFVRHAQVKSILQGEGS